MPIAKAPTADELKNHSVVSPEDWLAARRELLRREKNLTRLNQYEGVAEKAHS